MAIQDTDLLLINRAGASYKVAVSDLVDKVEDADLALVNRLGVSYNLTGANLKSGTFDDDDLFLVNRLGQSYQCLGSQIKTGLGPPPLPVLQSAEWSFQEKTGDVSLFKLNAVFNAPIDTTTPTSFNFDLTTGGNGSLGALFELSSLQFAQVWQGTTQGPTINSDPSITNFGNNDQSAYIIIKIPKSITYNGASASSKAVFGSASWRSEVTISQNNEITIGRLAQGFISLPDMFA